MQEEEHKKFIDVERLIGEKNPKALKWTPRFLINYLKRKLHQDEINRTLEENKHLHDYDFCNNIIDRFEINVISSGVENIPLEGGAIFVVNHPLGGMDALSIIHSIGNYRQDVKFIVNDILLSLKNLRGIFAGINKHGANSKDSLHALEELFSSNKAIFIFPAGLVSRRINKKVEDLEWKKTFISRAKKYNKTVVPVHLDGELSKFFYNLANFRTKLGIKMNIEMLYLADELYKQKNTTIRITYGEPIPASHFDQSKKDIEWAQWVKKQVYLLKDKEKN
ncbi:MAG: glycerol acyltransferase [Crocinitomicaceae bacterium]|nr:glycerol acyltransferase [Crocinitomicaceae bacterium]